MVKPGPILILGGGGFLGARLAEALCEPHEVWVTYRRASAARQAWLDKSGGKIRGFCFDSERQRDLPVGNPFAAIINLAMPGAAETQSDPVRSLDNALRGVNACLDLLGNGGAERLIHFSTFHVYGADGRSQITEGDPPAPRHPYGRNHLACEECLQTSPHASRVCIVRPTNIVAAPAHDDLGPQAGLMALDLCRQAAQQNRIKLQNDGQSYRDFLAVGDCLTAVKILLGADQSLMGGRLLNLASGTAIRLADVVAMIQKQSEMVLGHRPAAEFGHGTDAFRHPFRVAVTALASLGWRPKLDLEREIRAILEFFYHTA
ncbi:MAG: NAD(P)-dependent oxidoreductase [Verrucomicrobiota bacterium]